MKNLNDKQGALKQNLNKIIEDLNCLIDQSTSKIYNQKNEKSDGKKEINRAKLEKILEMKEKELISTKFQVNNYKQQYENILHKANEKISTKKYSIK